MKKLLALLLVTVIAFSVVGCGEKSTSDSGDYFSKQKVIDSPKWVAKLDATFVVFFISNI